VLRVGESGPSPDPAEAPAGRHRAVPAEPDGPPSGGSGPPETENDVTEQPQRSRRRLLGWSLLGLGALILLTAGWVTFRGLQAYRDLAAARDTVTAMGQEFESHGISQPARLVALAERFADQAAAARSAVDDPLFRAATIVPWIGPNVAAVRTIAAVADDIGSTMPAAAELTRSLNEEHLFPRDGVVDMGTVEAAAAALESTDAAVQHAIGALAGVDRGKVVAPLADAVDQMGRQLARIAPLTSTGARLGRLMVPMLGAEGPRQYLVVFQNPAELRATGGIFGAYAVLEVNHGAVSLDRAGSVSQDFGTADPPLAGIDTSLTDLYSLRLTSFPQDVNFTPDFPTAAELIARMYQNRFGGRLDGVIALDPLVVSVLLQGQPPIDIGDGMMLTSQSAPALLMSEIYARYPTSRQTTQRDALLTSAILAAYTAIASSSGRGAFRPIISGVKDLVDQRRVLVWSAHPAEEQQLLPTAVSGRLPVDTANAPTVGVFLNDGTGGKLDYYLGMDVRLGPGRCVDMSPEPGPALTTAALAVQLQLNAPSGGLPNYVISGSNVDHAVYRLQTNVLVVAPTGGAVSGLSIDGRAVPVMHGVDHGRAVAMATVVLTPGTSAVLEASLSFAPAADGDAVTPKVVTTPMATQASVFTVPFAGCGA
jgi:hypothetical protein